MYTQCPQCLTIYQIDEDALQASLGIVRCGHCSERFDALRTLSDTLPVSPEAALPEHAAEVLTPTLTEAIPSEAIRAVTDRQRKRPAPAVPPPKPDTQAAEPPAATRPDDTWSALLSGERAHALIADAAGIPPEAIQGDPAWQVIDLPIQTRFTELDITPMAPVEPAAGDAEDALPESPESIIDAAGSEPFTEPWSLDIPYVTAVEPAPPIEPPQPDIVAHSGHAEDPGAVADAWVEADSSVAFPEVGPGLDLQDAEPPEDDFASGTIVADESDAIRKTGPAEPHDESPVTVTDTAIMEHGPGDATVTEPVYVPPRRQRIRRGDWLWPLGCLILALVLAAQIAWAKRAALIRDPATQAWALRACANLDCRLPPIRNIAQLELLSRDIRPDPNTAGALMITATIRNDAAFRQPWPVVVVELTDLDNEVVAMRRFRPADYMPDPARRAAGIAPATTAAVAFEVADPGKRAVSFRFGFE